MPKVLTKNAAPAQTLLLSEKECAKYHAYLNGDDMPFDLGASVLAGSIGMRGDLLEKAVTIAEIFRRVCLSLHSKGKIPDALLKPFAGLPSVRSSILTAPFCLAYFRMDFFLNQNDPSASLKIMEVNSGGAGLTDYLRCIRYLRKVHQFNAPKGYNAIDVPDMLRSLLAYGQKICPTMKTLGLVGVENGSTDSLIEYEEYAGWLKENTNVEPVLLALTDGELSLLDHKKFPSRVKNLKDLDAVYFDWFENLPALEKVTKTLTDLGIVTIPARSDLLFEQKRFLAFLRMCEKPEGIMDGDWHLLQEAILPSFPLEEFGEHLEEMEVWPGIVLKMDLDCASENVFIYDFSKISFKEALIALDHTLRYGHPTSEPLPAASTGSAQAALGAKAGQNLRTSQPTWSLQQFCLPPHLPLSEPTPAWVGYDYAPYKFDLMTYLCYEEEIPRVLFGSRCFSREKYDELTEEGLEDILWGPVSTL